MKYRQMNLLWITSICIIFAAGCDKSDEVKAAAEAEKASLEEEKAKIEQEKKTAEAVAAAATKAALNAKSEAEKAKLAAAEAKAGMAEAKAGMAEAKIAQAEAEALVAEANAIKEVAEVAKEAAVAGQAAAQAMAVEANAEKQAAIAGQAAAQAAAAEANLVKEAAVAGQAAAEAIAEKANAEKAVAIAGQAAAEAIAEKANSDKAAAEAMAADAQAAAEKAQKQAQETIAEVKRLQKEEIERASVLGIMIQNKCLRKAKIKPELLGIFQKDILSTFQMTGAEFAAARNKFKKDPAFKASFKSGIAECPDYDPKYIQSAKKVAAKKKFKAFFQGSLFGSAGGSIQVKMIDGTITGKVKFKNGLQLKLHGKRTGTKFWLAERAGSKHNFRGEGRLDANGNRLVGAWKTVQGDKKRSGTLMASR